MTSAAPGTGLIFASFLPSATQVHLQVVISLQFEPQLRRGAALLKRRRGVSGDASSLFGDALNARVWHVHLPGQRAGGHLTVQHRFIRVQAAQQGQNFKETAQQLRLEKPRIKREWRDR